MLAVDELIETVFERAPSGAAARIVAVETEHDLRNLAQEFLDVDRRGCRAERRDRITDPVLGERHDVHIALDDDDAAGIANCAATLVKTVEFAPLFE